MRSRLETGYAAVERRRVSRSQPARSVLTVERCARPGKRFATGWSGWGSNPPRKSLRSTRLGSTRKSAVELFVRTNPEPQPLVTAAKCDRTNVFGDANRPGTWIKAQSLQPQTRMRRILAEELICASGSGLGFSAAARDTTAKTPVLRERSRACSSRNRSRRPSGMSHGPLTDRFRTDPAVG